MSQRTANRRLVPVSTSRSNAHRRAEAMLEQDPVLRKTMRMFRKLFDRETYMESLAVVQRYMRPASRTLENDVLRFYYSVYVCVALSVGLVYIFDFEDNLCPKKAREIFVRYMMQLRRILQHPLGKDLANYAFVTMVALIKRYGVTWIAVGHMHSRMFHDTLRRRLLTTVVVRETLPRVIPPAERIIGSMESQTMQLFDMVKGMFDDVMKDLENIDYNNEEQMQEIALEIDKISGPISEGRKFSARFVQVLGLWISILYNFMFGKMLEHGARAGLHVTQGLLHLVANQLIAVRFIPGITYSERMIRNLAERIPDLARDDTAIRTVLGNRRRGANQSRSNRPRTSTNRPRLTARPSPTVTIPKTAEERIRFIRARGGEPTYTRGSRKGQTRDLANLLREAKRVSNRPTRNA